MIPLTRYICPFCLETIKQTNNPDDDEIEGLALQHITKHHPIKWRFNRKFRKAVKYHLGTV